MHALILFCLAMTLAAADPTPPPRPRLLIDAAGIEALRARLAEPGLAAALAALRRAGEESLALPPPARELKGYRLLDVSREVLRRTNRLGVLHLLDRDPRWAAGLARDIDAACAFSDWNPGHFLDVAEMATAVALADDWLAGAVPDAQRAGWRAALRRLALEPSLAGERWWIVATNNWNQVCHGGLALAAFALAEDEPELSRRVLERARANIDKGLGAYAPAGLYPEGPGYWAYGTAYSVLLAAATERRGEDWGIRAAPGFAASFDAVLQLHAPSGRSFNFADSGPGRMSAPWHLWMGARSGRPEWVAAGRAAILAGDKDRFAPLSLLWWGADPAGGASPPTAWTGRGTAEIAVLRERWGDPEAVAVSLKGGALAVSHGHLDAGSVMLEADGVRWIEEHGMEPAIYAGTDAWSVADGSKRWRYLRVSNLGHATLVLGDRLQSSAGANPVGEPRREGDGWAVEMDGSAALAGQCRRWTRTVSLHGRRVRIADRVLEADPGLALGWRLTTRTTVAVDADGRSAILSQGGKRLLVRVVEAPPGARLAALPMDPPADPPQSPNPDWRMLVLAMPAPLPADLALAVELEPPTGP